MKGIRFYEEYTGHKRRKDSKPLGNVLAVVVENSPQVYDGVTHYDAVGAVFDLPNSAVASAVISTSYLRNYTKRISERRARELHPLLFQILDADTLELVEDIYESVH